MSSKSPEDFIAPRQAVIDVKGWNASGRTSCHSGFNRQDKGGPVKSFCHLCGHNAKNAAMPAFFADYDGPRPFGSTARSLKHVHCLTEDRFPNLLSSHIQAVQPFRQTHGLIV